MAGRLTVEIARTWHLREDMHHNGGKAFFAYTMRCIEQPRLTRYDRYERKDRSVTSTWRTDGIAHPTFEAAVEALNVPPVFDAEELTYLATLPTEWTKKPIPNSIDWTVNQRTKDKGGVEWRNGERRITPAGRAALAQEAADGDPEGGGSRR